MPSVSPQPNIAPLRLEPSFSWHFWILVALTGIGAGIAGGLLMLLLHAVQHFFWAYGSGQFLDAVRHASIARRVGVLAAAGALVALARGILKLAGGGHGGEVAAAIWFHAGRLAPLPTLIRAVLSVVSVGMGASLGREATPKQIGALVADMLCDWRRIPDGQRRLLVACGAGAGLAAVYNVPFGGALFALEVLLGTLSLPLVAPALATSFIATAVAWLLLPDRATYIVPFFGITPGLIVWGILAGPLAGFASIVYIRLIARADALKPDGWMRFAAPLVAFALLGAASIPFPELLGNGKDTVQEAFLGHIGIPLVFVLLVLKPLATAACLGSGGNGGLFTPTLTFGAMLGGSLGQLWEQVWPGAPPGSCAMIGAAAVLAGAMQAPVSAIVLVLELTRRLDTLMPAVVIAVAGAVIVTRLFEPRSIYSARIHAGRLAGRGTDNVASSAGYSELLHLLLKRGDDAAPLEVIDEKGASLGRLSPHKVVAPTPSAAPLETATAADFTRRHHPTSE